jgi:hypothetical protein
VSVFDALVRFFDADKANANLASNDGYLGTASLSVKAEQSYPFVTNGASLPTTFTRTIALLKSGASGRRGGALDTAMWVRVYHADGMVAVDYQDASSNTPVEIYSTVIDPKNYYYGSVWRPRDGFVYQSYPDTKFSSEQACRNQTVIDWRRVFSAHNLGWSCVHRTSS